MTITHDDAQDDLDRTIAVLQAKQDAIVRANPGRTKGSASQVGQFAIDAIDDCIAKITALRSAGN